MRHLELHEELIPKISAFVEQGMCFRDSYLLAGVNHYTGSEWRRQALRDLEKNKTDSIYIKLSKAMNEAKAKFHKSLVKCVVDAGKEPKHWQAAMTLLERIDPETYSRFVRTKEYENLGLDPTKQSPLELVSGILSAVMKGKISGMEGKQMSEIIGNIIKVEENGKGWEIINQLKAELKKEGK